MGAGECARVDGMRNAEVQDHRAPPGAAVNHDHRALFDLAHARGPGLLHDDLNPPVAAAAGLAGVAGGGCQRADSVRREAIPSHAEALNQHGEHARRSLGRDLLVVPEAALAVAVADHIQLQCPAFRELAQVRPGSVRGACREARLYRDCGAMSASRYSRLASRDDEAWLRMARKSEAARPGKAPGMCSVACEAPHQRATVGLDTPVRYATVPARPYDRCV